MMRNKLGEFVQAKRKELRLSQRALSEKAQVSRTALTKLEAGDVIPETQTLEKLATAMGMPLSKLLDMVQGRATKEGKDNIVAIIEQLPSGKRKLVEEFILLIKNYDISINE